MQARAIPVFLASLILSATVLSDLARAQGNPATVTETNSIGRVVTTSGSATIEHVNAVVVQANAPASGPAGQAKIGDPVYMGDVVQTGADGRIGVTFNDGTAFNLSSNARMVLNEFVYDPNGKSNSTLFSLTKGTFTFVAGKVAKTGDMKIDTPVATMGIRGTTPHVEISADGKVSFTTLIEENKEAIANRGMEKRGDADQNKRAAALKRRQAKTGSSSPAPDNIRVNLKICKGC